MSQLATKDDVCKMKTQVIQLTEAVMKRLETLEGQFLDLESKASKTEKCESPTWKNNQTTAKHK